METKPKVNVKRFSRSKDEALEKPIVEKKTRGKKKVTIVEEPIAYKVTKENVKFIIEEIKKNKTITIDDLLIKLKNKFTDLDLSKMHIHRIIKDNNITLKLTRLRHEPITRYGKEIDINKKIKEFYNEI